MAKFDAIIANGKLVTAVDTMDCDLAIKDGRIAALGTDLVGHAKGYADQVTEYQRPANVSLLENNDFRMKRVLRSGGEALDKVSAHAGRDWGRDINRR